MKKTMKVVLLLLLILTVVYIGAIAYASTQTTSSEYGDSQRYVLYVACKCNYTLDSPPSVWYEPEELGIIAFHEHSGSPHLLEITVDRQREPFPLRTEKPIFLYKSEFWIVGDKFITFLDWDNTINWQIPVGAALGTIWICIGIFFFKGRLKERKQ